MLALVESEAGFESIEVVGVYGEDSIQIVYFLWFFFGSIVALRSEIKCLCFFLRIDGIGRNKLTQLPYELSRFGWLFGNKRYFLE